MRKLFTFTVAAALAFTFAACENQNQTADTATQDTTQVAPEDPATTEGGQSEGEQVETKDTTQAE